MSAATISTITPQDLATRLEGEQDLELIDVRTPVEYREVHVSFARNVPLDTLDITNFKERSSEQPLYVICRSGGRGQKACEALQAAGIENVLNVSGGTLAWEAAGLPVLRGKKAISLERQVRIAAGSLVLLGVVLGVLVHPGFLGISAFVGAGLTFAGITDTCGMGMMLAKMPWNQVNDEQSCCATK